MKRLELSTLLEDYDEDICQHCFCFKVHCRCHEPTSEMSPTEFRLASFRRAGTGRKRRRTNSDSCALRKSASAAVFSRRKSIEKLRGDSTSDSEHPSISWRKSASERKIVGKLPEESQQTIRGMSRIMSSPAQLASAGTQIPTVLDLKYGASAARRRTQESPPKSRFSFAGSHTTASDQYNDGRALIRKNATPKKSYGSMVPMATSTMVAPIAESEELHSVTEVDASEKDKESSKKDESTVSVVVSGGKVLSYWTVAGFLCVLTINQMIFRSLTVFSYYFAQDFAINYTDFSLVVCMNFPGNILNLILVPYYSNATVLFVLVVVEVLMLCSNAMIVAWHDVYALMLLRLVSGFCVAASQTQVNGAIGAFTDGQRTTTSISMVNCAFAISTFLFSGAGSVLDVVGAVNYFIVASTLLVFASALVFIATPNWRLYEGHKEKVTVKKSDLDSSKTQMPKLYSAKSFDENMSKTNNSSNPLRRKSLGALTVPVTGAEEIVTETDDFDDDCGSAAPYEASAMADDEFTELLPPDSGTVNTPNTPSPFHSRAKTTLGIGLADIKTPSPAKSDGRQPLLLLRRRHSESPKKLMNPLKAMLSPLSPCTGDYGAITTLSGSRKESLLSVDGNCARRSQPTSPRAVSARTPQPDDGYERDADDESFAKGAFADFLSPSLPFDFGMAVDIVVDLKPMSSRLCHEDSDTSSNEAMTLASVRTLEVEKKRHDALHRDDWFVVKRAAEREAFRRLRAETQRKQRRRHKQMRKMSDARRLRELRLRRVATAPRLWLGSGNSPKTHVSPKMAVGMGTSLEPELDPLKAAKRAARKNAQRNILLASESQTPKFQKKFYMWDVLSLRDMQLILLSQLTYKLALNGFTFTLSEWMKLSYGLGPTEVGSMNMLLAVGCMLGTTSVIVLNARLGMYLTCALGTLLSLVSTGLCPLFYALGISKGPPLFAACFSSFVYMFGNQLYFNNIIQVTMDCTPTRNLQTAIQGLLFTTGAAGGMLGTVSSNMLYAWNGKPAVDAASVVYCLTNLACVLGLAAIDRMRQKAAGGRRTMIQKEVLPRNYRRRVALRRRPATAH